RQTYVDVSGTNIRNHICYVIENLILRPSGLEPIKGFCGVSLQWSCFIICATTTVYVFRCSRVFVKREFQSFWTELHE
ncbi:hypothetical protein PSTT_06966, partial [Puccinia striiformis]